MQSLFNLKRSCLIALAIAVCMVAFAGAASANSITLTKTGGTPGPSSYSLSSTFIVTVFANLGPTGGGNVQVTVSLTYDQSVITAVSCLETPGLQFVGDGVWAPLTANCGAFNPGDGGLVTPGIVLGIEQSNFGIPGSGSFGTLELGTITFHAAADGTDTITASLDGGGGFLGADFVNRTSGIPLDSLVVTVVPEPTTLALLGLGVLGLGLSGRRLRRR